MREFDEATITDAGLERVANTPDLRARRLSQALVRHLHAFIWEIEPTEAEWEWEIRREMDGDWFKPRARVPARPSRLRGTDPCRVNLHWACG
jgi:hypothetical protein